MNDNNNNTNDTPRPWPALKRDPWGDFIRAARLIPDRDADPDEGPEPLTRREAEG